MSTVRRVVLCKIKLEGWELIVEMKMELRKKCPFTIRDRLLEQLSNLK